MTAISGFTERPYCDGDLPKLMDVVGAVMRHAMAAMVQHGLTTATVNHNAENTAAAQLYASLGFIRCHETFGYRRPSP